MSKEWGKRENWDIKKIVMIHLNIRNAMTDLTITIMTKGNSNLEKHNKLNRRKKIICELAITLLLQKKLSQAINPFIALWDKNNILWI